MGQQIRPHNPNLTMLAGRQREENRAFVAVEQGGRHRRAFRHPADRALPSLRNQRSPLPVEIAVRL
ncbi:hypothetical protein NKI12_11110 [Mesorhizobium australicum]|jgi:hypothetical protein|uniref:Uncharacterized protein n=1 Tax=Mesorhizobium australicum TaxID=536018 RepID=A0ACC6SW05_9HYPH|nr:MULTISPECIES: hypothetical protein [unclassified Mesorhizobium]ESY79172.1 hypothetical protein X739_30710 [Mesorhizobium sp. LNHC220B00]ESY89875.1 hypothetical protein X741_28810 [Mesorhizobium sp. LNHC229A00]ESZ00109.1 hypothetical protein X738_12305 [Mesorhizobium sp. LNHC209A00]